MKRVSALGLTAVALVLLVPRPGVATSVEALDEAELVDRAACIFWGDCVSTRAEWNAARTQIFTTVTFAPREVLKGEATALVELKVPGGELDGKAYVVHGMPRFRPGEEVVLYASARHQRSGVAVPVGLGQGYYVVDRSGDGLPRARRDTSDLRLLERGDATGRTGRVEEVGLHPLLERIRTEVTRQGAPR